MSEWIDDFKPYQQARDILTRLPIKTRPDGSLLVNGDDDAVELASTLEACLKSKNIKDVADMNFHAMDQIDLFGFS
jgi:inorganic pyrophosphatase